MLSFVIRADANDVVGEVAVGERSSDILSED
jgi:hypothetical protein